MDSEDKKRAESVRRRGLGNDIEEKFARNAEKTSTHIRNDSTYKLRHRF